jgi:hypothetical protein
MLSAEVSLESARRDVGAAVATALPPGSVLVLPLVGAMLLPVLVPLPATLALPATLLVPGSRVARVARLGSVCAGRRRSPPTSVRRLLRLRRRTLRIAAPVRLALLRLRRGSLRGASPPLRSRLGLRRGSLRGASPPRARLLSLRGRRRGLLLSRPRSGSALPGRRPPVVIVLRIRGTRRADEHQQRGQPHRLFIRPRRPRSQCFDSAHIRA